MAKVNRNNLVFEKNNRSCGDTASVWHYFLRSTDGLYAECQKCNKILKHSGSTSPLHNHLNLVHSINLKTVKGLQQTTEDNENTDLLTQNSERECEPKMKKMKINDFFKADDDDVQTAVSKMAALDGLPFRVFSTSEILRKLFKKSGYNLPQSPNAIKDMVMAKCGQLKKDLKKEISELISKGHKFSTTLDEWTSAKNRRYMNVNIHSPALKSKPFRNLGLSRIRGRGTSENCYNILKEKLSQFGLLIDVDIVCIVTDGASVMRALGQRTSTQSQLCLAHGIQCAVLDVLYKKDSGETGPYATIQSAEPTEHDDIEDSDNENEDDEEGYSMLPENTTFVPLIVYKDLVHKVRQIVKYFKNSPTRMDLLNTHLDNDNKNLQVILDCKTRWSSLADMITRFLRLKDGIMKTMIDLKNDTKFSSSEIEILKDLSISLNVIKATVEAICREDANLLTAETALKFMISKLTERDSTISQQLAESLKARIIQRRQTALVSTLKYLHNPTKFYEEEKSCDDVFKISFNIVPGFIVELLKKYLPTSTETATDTDDDDYDVALIHMQQQKISEESLSINEQLSKEIEKSLLNTPSTSTATIPKQNEDLETLCRVQMALFDRGGPRSHHLSQIYDFLMTIPPTSVGSERAFSSTGYLCNKLRTSLNDSTLDSLSFLRSYYQTLKK